MCLCFATHQERSSINFYCWFLLWFSTYISWKFNIYRSTFLSHIECLLSICEVDNSFWSWFCYHLQREDAFRARPDANFGWLLSHWVEAYPCRFYSDLLDVDLCYRHLMNKWWFAVLRYQIFIQKVSLLRALLNWTWSFSLRCRWNIFW